MNEFVFRVKIEAPEVCAVLAQLLGALRAVPTSAPVPVTGVPEPSFGTPPAPGPISAPAPVQPAPPAQAPVPLAVAPGPVQAAPVQASVAAPIAAAPVAPTPTVPTAPTAPARQFQFEDIQLAATSLVDAGKRDAVLGLLGQFQVRALSELPADQYGAFATALRGLGAKI